MSLNVSADQAVSGDTKVTKTVYKNANHGNRIKVAIDIAHKARNQEYFKKGK